MNYCVVCIFQNWGLFNILLSKTKQRWVGRIQEERKQNVKFQALSLIMTVMLNPFLSSSPQFVGCFHVLDSDNYSKYLWTNKIYFKNVTNVYNTLWRVSKKIATQAGEVL